MDHINDRGSKKWTSMMIPEHEEMLRQLWQEQTYQEKPQLDQQKQMEIDTRLQLAYNKDLPVDVSYYDYNTYNVHNVRDKLLVIDQFAGELQLKETHTVIPLADIVDVVVD